jgi:DNA-directed RNA polymerase specialized sigma24 family protein
MENIKLVNELYIQAWKNRNKITFSIYLSVFIDEFMPYLKRCASKTTHINSDQEELVSEYIRRITRYMPNYAICRGEPIGYLRTIIHSANKRYITNRYKQPKKIETAKKYYAEKEEYRNVKIMNFGLIEDISEVLGEDRVEKILDNKFVEISDEERDKIRKML